MTAASLYNVVFSGDIAPGTDAESARQRVSAVFDLTGQQLDRLFSGRRVVVKRDLDLDVALRLQRAFRSAGALVRIESGVDGRVIDPLGSASPVSRRGTGGRQAGLTLAPIGPLLEQVDEDVPARLPDSGHLRLVPGYDWSLEDCTPPPAVRPGLSGDTLSLMPVVELSDDDDGA